MTSPQTLTIISAKSPPHQILDGSTAETDGFALKTLYAGELKGGGWMVSPASDISCIARRGASMEMETWR